MLIFQNSLKIKQNFCEENLTKKDLYNSLENMQNDKFPGKDGLTKEFHEAFWTELKEIFVDSVSEAKRPISLLNVDLNILSKIKAT